VVIEDGPAEFDQLDPTRYLVFKKDKATAIIRVGGVVYFKNEFGWGYRNPKDRMRGVRGVIGVENQDLMDALVELLQE
jgi:hypothetical protein